MRDRAPQIITISVVIIVLITLFFTIKILAENRTEDFVIDNYIMDQGIYDTKEKAIEGIDISEIHWGTSGYCVVATAYIDHEGAKISTSIPLKIPLFKYAFNTADKDDISVVGNC